MTDVTIRPANIDDLPQLLEFEQSIIAAERPFDATLKADPISYYDLKAFILSDSAEVIVAEINNQLIASGHAHIRESKPYVKHTQHCYLGFMYVKPSYRGKGVNQLVLDGLKAWSIEQGIYDFSLNVYVDNQAAIRAYEKAGFKSNLIEMCASVSKE